MEEIMESVICLGCGRTGTIENLTESDSACPECGYENNLPPYRLLTLGEMLEDKNINEYTDVRMDLFLSSLFDILSEGKNEQEKPPR